MCVTLPRVAPESQPWALWRKPVGLLTRGQKTREMMTVSSGGRGLVDGFVACFEFADGLKHLRGIDVMDFEALADRAEESDGEFAAEMFAEFFEASKDDRLVLGVDVEQFVGEQVESEHFEETEDAGLGRGIDVSDAAGINDVESDADGDGFTVAQTIF